MREVIAKCPGACGELLQGWVEEEQRIISCGIERYATARIQDSAAGQRRCGVKAWKALELTVEKLKVPKKYMERLSLSVQTDLPIAKGMASSTADIAAVSLATAGYFDQSISHHDIVDICLSIERTDSIVYPQLTSLSLKNGKHRQHYNWSPNYYVLIFEPAATLDTAVFHDNKTDLSFFKQREAFQQVYNQFEEAVAKRDLRLLGKAASKSALLNQDILAKPYFQEILEINEQFHGLGVVVAHSGTVAGILMETTEELPQMLSYIYTTNLPAAYPTIYLQQSSFQGAHFSCRGVGSV